MHKSPYQKFSGRNWCTRLLLERAWASPTLVKLCPLWCLYVSMFVYLYTLYRTSFRKFPRVLIHWTASILLSVIQFRKWHHVQIIETASILHLQWAMMSMCTLLVLLGQTELANYSYSKLSYVSAKLYRSSENWRCIVQQWRNYGRAGGAVAPPPAFEEPETVTAALSL